MVRLEKAALLLLLTTSSSLPVNSFQEVHPISKTQNFPRQRQQQNQQHANIRSKNLGQPWHRGVASSSQEFPNENSPNGENLGNALSSMTTSACDSIASVVRDEPDYDADAIAQKQQRVQERTKTYTVTLPLTSASAAATLEKSKSQVLSMGMTLGQINKGRELRPVELDLDSLDLVQAQSQAEREDTSTLELMDESSLMRRIDGEFQGLVISAISPTGAAWAAGVRPGDILKSASATVGSQRWPKSSLEGIRSAIQSRKAMSGSIQLELQRLGEIVDNQFELTLTKPIGLELRETGDGYVEVSGFTQNAPTLVQYAVKVGDRVLAVDAALGDRLWPVSTVEGVISAVTSRLPGQQITFRFQRMGAITDDASPAVPIAKRRQEEASVAATTVEEAELNKRCRDVIKRYMKGTEVPVGKLKFVEKYDVPGLVADKVMDALASAGARVESLTLATIMGAYISCGQAQKAIDAFEAAVGLHSNGSSMEVLPKFEGKNSKFITHNEDALNIYTTTALLKALAMKGDLSSVRRVLAAIGGRDDSVVDGHDVASWPNTGPGGAMQPDTRCYNIAISALADSRAQNAMDLALQLFDALKDPSRKEADPLQKDVVSYNAVINGMTIRGRSTEAVELFYDMKNKGLRPDIYSYTSLVKALAAVSEDDVEELLYDMKEQGVALDVILFNTIIKTLCKQKKIKSARRMVGFMEEYGVAPDSQTYGMLMKALIDTGNPSAALTLFETACSDQRTVELTENVHLFTTAISAAAAISEHDRALELLARMNQMGLAPNLKTMTALVGACLAADKPDLAYDIYKRISEPDGYAMTQGIRALGAQGRIGDALSMLESKQARRLTGKQVMFTYERMIQHCLKKRDFFGARSTFQHILKNRNIPSKAIYQTVFDELNLFPRTVRGIAPVVNRNEETLEKFTFLLHILDLVSSRNLPCEGNLYHAIIRYGSQLGGLPRKICTLLTSAKELESTQDESETKEILEVESWEDLFLRYDDLKAAISQDALRLPALNVRINPKDVGKILRAEKSISYAKRKPRRQEV